MCTERKNEKLKNRIDVRLIKKPEDYLALVSKPSFMSRKNLIAFREIKNVLTHNKPSYDVMSTLDLSKNFMYKFYHHYQN